MARIILDYFPGIAHLTKDINFDNPPCATHEKELLSIKLGLGVDTKCTFKNTSIVISNARDDAMINLSIAILMKVLDTYQDVFKDVFKMLTGVKRVPKDVIRSGSYVRPSVSKGSKIDDLRGRLPELFVRNYTRECHRLPVLLESDEEARIYEEDLGRLVIRYPMEGRYARWYSSPSDDLYVGLKVNRLSNKSTFKYIVVCYTSNHLENPSKKTYQYYNNDDEPHADKTLKDIKTLKTLSPGRHGPIPRTMEAEYGIYDYKRMGTGGTFISCMESALHITINMDDIKDKYNVLRQELWNVTDELIDEQIISEHVDASVYYRVFEETYKCNIIVIEVNSQGKYNLSIPYHRSYYIWEPCRYNRYIIILKNVRKLYQETSISHELIVHQDGTLVFRLDDGLVSKLVETKRLCTMAPVYENGRPKRRNIIGQYLDENGKCTLLFLKDGTVVECGTRPYACPIVSRHDMLSKCSIVYKHMVEYKGMTWVSTTSDYMYFPDDESFQQWMDL